jgi:hypothetical protein
VDSISDDRRDGFRDLLLDLNPVDLLSSLRVEIDSVSVWVSGAESLPYGIKIADVVLGPLDFRQDAD